MTFPRTLRVSAGGGPVDTLTVQVSANDSHRWPHVLPNGAGVLITRWLGSVDASETVVLDFDTGETKRLVAGVDARYVATGHLIYATGDGALLAVPFDLDRLEVTGNPVALLEGLTVKVAAVAELAIADNGTMLYISGFALEGSLVSVSRLGIRKTLVERLSNPSSPRVSPDGRYIAVRDVVDGNSDIWVYDQHQETLSRLTFEGDNDYPVWALDGQHIYFTSLRQDADRDIYRRAADGSGAVETVLTRDGEQWEFLEAPGDSVFVFREQGPVTNRDIWIGRRDGDPTPYVANEFNERAPALSPNGQWLVYTSDESGQDEIYLREFPDPRGRWQVSTDHGIDAVWSSSGRAIFYIDGDMC